ncbi:MAG: polymer-forming cytoskeletal protein [Proteobacteria bacterium]|nr:polymer-forming cytoskeletal protein [Pseudomonadota bacterium]
MNIPPKALRQRGSILVYLALALVLFGAFAMAGASRFGASIVGVSLPNCATQARYMSEAGMRYALARLRACTTEAEVNAAVAQMNGVTFTVDAAKGLTFTPAVSYSSGTGLATVASSGRGCPGALSVPASTAASSVNLPGINTASEASTSEALKGTYSGTSAIAAGSMTGNLTTSSARISGGTSIGGSVNYLETGPTCLQIGGGAMVGTVGNSNYVCSETCVVVGGGATVNGNIYAQGDVNVSSKVNGDIYSGGDVHLSWGAEVSGNIYAHGTFSTPPYSSLYAGTVTTGYAKPNHCATYTLPAHTTVPSNIKLNIGSNTYTFIGSTDLSDKTNAFSSITTGGGSKICFDLSLPDSYINIFSKGSMTINGDIYVRTSTTSQCFDGENKVTNVNFAKYAYAKRVYMDVGGTVSFNGGSNWFGTIYAADNIYPGSGGVYIGAFYTNKAYNPGSSWSTSRFVPSDYVAKYWP